MIDKKDIINDVELIDKLRNLPRNDTNEFKFVDTFAIYFDNNLFKTISFKLYELIETSIKIENIDYICAVPPCGIPIAASVSLMTNRPLIVPLPQEVHILGVSNDFHAGSEIERGKRILLVDSVINSGISARTTKQKLDSIEGKFAGLVVALFNDMFPDKRSDKFKKDELNNIKYLYKVSEIS